MSLETKRILITIKAPPNPSMKHQETNCCAGIEMETKKWIRLYPIPFRLLDDDQKFPKYSIITVKCKKPLRDKRIESYEVDQDSITIQDRLDTGNQWAKRKEIVLSTESLSFCKILEDIKIKKSLGVFKPAHIKFHFKESVTKAKKKHEAAYSQYHLFDRKLDPIEQIPFTFYYEFKCYNRHDCQGHTLKIHDWELNQAYRKWRHKYKNRNILLEKIKEKWLNDLCGLQKDVYFYVGNIWRRPKQFMILGVFYPPKITPTLFKH